MWYRNGNKYNNQKTVYRDKRYDSKKEANRAFELDMLQRDGQVKKFKPQVKVSCIVNDKLVCNYFADFKVEYPNGKVVYEDVKGVRTAIYKLKKKLVFACTGIKIQEL